MSPLSLWNKCFLRSFAHRLASVAKEEVFDTISVDSFIDVVDLKPEHEKQNLAAEFEERCIVTQDKNNNSESSDEDEILPATFIQGPKSVSQINGGDLKRRTSQKVGRDLIVPLMQNCCTDIQQNFKEFLRFDFSNAQIFEQKNSETLLTPDSHGKRLWTKDTEKPRTPLVNAVCFKIASVANLADKLAIKINVSNPNPVVIEVSF